MAEGTILRFDLTAMRLFLTVMEQDSLTQGAQAMNLALASVSERVSGMESALGAPLLERTRRGVRTTAADDGALDSVRQRGGNSGVIERSIDHAATVVILVDLASSNGVANSVMTSVCM